MRGPVRSFGPAHSHQEKAFAEAAMMDGVRQITKRLMIGILDDPTLAPVTPMARSPRTPAVTKRHIAPRQIKFGMRSRK